MPARCPCAVQLLHYTVAPFCFRAMSSSDYQVEMCVTRCASLELYLGNISTYTYTWGPVDGASKPISTGVFRGGVQNAHVPIWLSQKGSTEQWSTSDGILAVS